MAETDEGALSIREFCQQYATGRTRTYEEISAGRLLAKKHGARTLIPREAARRWLDSLPNARGNQ